MKGESSCEACDSTTHDDNLFLSDIGLSLDGGIVTSAGYSPTSKPITARECCCGTTKQRGRRFQKHKRRGHCCKCNHGWMLFNSQLRLIVATQYTVESWCLCVSSFDHVD